MARSTISSVTRGMGFLTSALTTLLLIGAPAADASTAGVWQYWSYPTRPSTVGFYNTDQYVTIAQTGTTRFFSHQLYHDGGGVSYIGLQDTPYGKKAIFSVWDSPEAEAASGGVTCEPFDGEGVGQKCWVPYEWEIGVTYRLRVWATGNRDDGSIQWLGTVMNTQTQEETFLGYTWGPATAGYISSSVSWIENYKLNIGGSCADETGASAKFTMPVIDNNAYTANFGESMTGTCAADGHSSRIQRVSGGAILVE